MNWWCGMAVENSIYIAQALAKDFILPLEDGLSKPFTKYVDISQNGRFE
jgi:hypothetical protein